MAHELERRGGVGMRRPVDAVLEDQVLLGERLGLAVVPSRASRWSLLRSTSIEVVSPFNVFLGTLRNFCTRIRGGNGYAARVRP